MKCLIIYKNMVKKKIKIIKVEVEAEVDIIIKGNIIEEEGAEVEAEVGVIVEEEKDREKMKN